jgi:hypothetical protein
MAALGIGAALLPFADALWASRPVFRTGIELGESAYSSWLSAADSSMRVGLDVRIMPRFSAEELRGDGLGEQVGLYRFPMHYRVRDQAGRLLMDQWVLVDAAQQRTLRQDYRELSEPVSLSVSASFDPFPVERGQPVRVEALLLPDRVYGAEVEQAELRVFRQPPPAMAAIRQGLFGMIAGLGVMVLGLLGELLIPVRPTARPVRRHSGVHVM